jgi:hypothetical protein
MKEKNVNTKTIEVTAEYLRALRKAAGAAIDPQTAEVMWEYTQLSDPYGDRPYVPPEASCVGRQLIVRAQGGDVWIWEGDLPEATRRAIRERPLPEGWPPGLEFLEDVMKRGLERHQKEIGAFDRDEAAE